MLAAAEPPAPAESEPIDLGDRVEMFLDASLLESLDGARLALAPPVREEIVLVTDRPWEGPQSAYFNVFRDGDRVRLYYRGHMKSDLDEDQCTCTAESADGIRFERPELGLHSFGGSTRNNIVHHGIESHNLFVFRDTKPGVDERERYKAVGGGWEKLYGLVSPDGHRWRRIQEDPITTKGTFDSLNVVFWDPGRGRYLLFSRYFASDVRAIQMSESTDFLHWNDPRPIDCGADAPREHFYTNAILPCPGAEHVLLAFPMRFVPERTKLEGYAEPGVSDAVFFSSRGGLRWNRSFREAWLRPGNDPHNWSQRSNMPARGIIETGPGEFSLYASEHYEWPDARLRRLTVRKHGFASLHAGAEGGRALTKPLRLSGASLRLNFATSAAGLIKVEVRDAGGRPIPGFGFEDSEGLFGDEFDREYRWKGGPGLPGGSSRVVRLCFALRDADLYALRMVGPRS
jgi:hypothetical protein